MGSAPIAAWSGKLLVMATGALGCREWTYDATDAQGSQGDLWRS